MTVEATFPERPIVERLPLAVAVVYDEAFQSYTLAESIQRGIGRLTWRSPGRPFRAMLTIKHR